LFKIYRLIYKFYGLYNNDKHFGATKSEVAYFHKNIYMKIFVAGLPPDLDDAELTEIFEKFGLIASARVVMDKATHKSKGFGFVDMPNTVEAKDAIESLNGISLGRKPLVVKEAEEKGSDGGGGYRPGGDRPSGPPRFSNRDRRRY
jgi:cold-inducible RNA-binding protein